MKGATPNVTEKEIGCVRCGNDWQGRMKVGHVIHASKKGVRKKRGAEGGEGREEGEEARKKKRINLSTIVTLIVYSPGTGGE